MRFPITALKFTQKPELSRCGNEHTRSKFTRKRSVPLLEKEGLGEIYLD